jgi:hypothetical protein
MAFMACTRCHSTIWQGEDVYEKADKGQVARQQGYMTPRYDFLEDVICKRCYRCLPFNEQAYYKKVREK